MHDRSRRALAAWAGVCAVALVVLGILVSHDRAPLDGLDTWGAHAEAWADRHDWLWHVLRVIEVGFGTVGAAILTAALAVWLLVLHQRRAAAYAVGVMVVTSLLTTAVKLWVGRDRPQWQDSLHLLESKSFPSGHASSAAAYAGVLIVLAQLFLRRASTRRAVTLAVLSFWLLVCLDRVLLGRHYPTDVIGGSLLGASVVLAGLAVFDPRPRRIVETTEPLPEVYTSQRRLAVVLNPVKVDSVGQFRALVSSLASEAGWGAPLWYFTTVEDSGTGMAHDAALAGADLVLVCGGDGTVREVCAELAGTGIPVGIVPAGTGNLLARNLEIPLYLRAALDVGLNGQDRAIDLVEVSGDGLADTHFMVMAGMGFDAAIMEGVNEDIKKRVGWIAYVISALRSLMFPARRVDISVDGGEFTRHWARTVVVGNVGHLQAGMPLLPDAAIDDGLLDVVVLHPKRFFSWIPLAVRVLTKRRRTDETINRMTGRTVVLRSVSDIPRQLDGDSVGSGHELRMECLHGRVLVRVPR